MARPPEIPWLAAGTGVDRPAGDLEMLEVGVAATATLPPVHEPLLDLVERLHRDAGRTPGDDPALLDGPASGCRSGYSKEKDAIIGPSTSDLASELRARRSRHHIKTHVP